MLLDELRAELGIEKGKLERIDNFKAKVMNIAEREINSRTDINFMYEWIKTGRGVTGVRFAVREQVTKPIKTLPGTEADMLRQRLEDAGMPREEAIGALRKWARSDPNRIVWHLDEVARLRRAGKVAKPLAWLRAGLKRDYRPQGSLFERKREAARDPDAARSGTGMQSVGDVLRVAKPEIAS